MTFESLKGKITSMAH